MIPSGIPRSVPDSGIYIPLGLPSGSYTQDMSDLGEAWVNWLTWNKLTEEYIISGSGIVKDIANNCWGLIGDRGIAQSIQGSGNTLIWGITENPGLPIYLGTLSSGITLNQNSRVITLQDIDVRVYDPGYLVTGTISGKIRFYHNTNNHHYELLDAVNCPI
jgi:hypothetical protein